MPLVDPIPRTQLAELEPFFRASETEKGFLPNSLPTMAHVPGLPEAFLQLADVALAPGALDQRLKILATLVASAAAGCTYCQAHTAGNAISAGIDEELLRRAWTFQTDEGFDIKWRLALQFAFSAGQVPNAVTDDLRSAMRAHFEPGELAELVAAISLYGFLNRWNDSMATELEAVSEALAEGAIPGWTIARTA
jgi:AhpD family alkylhydroperoxidase